MKKIIYLKLFNIIFSIVLYAFCFTNIHVECLVRWLTFICSFIGLLALAALYTHESGGG